MISKDLLHKNCWSADHYETQMPCTMTELANILNFCRDTILKVGFKKQLDAKVIASKLENLKNKKSDLNEIAKGLIKGEQCEIVGHLIESDNQLGRSVIVDLNKPVSSNIRQVDHRSIDYIIFRNVKYYLDSRRCTTVSKFFGLNEGPIKPDMDEARWNIKELKVGD